MHNNYYFLRKLSDSLGRRLEGFSIVSCFSQNKDEMVFELNDTHRSFFIKAHLLSSFSCLSFPDQFNRARKNSVDLFDQIILKKYQSITQFENERSFALNFEKGYSLIFKMHANRSNILLAQNNKVIQIFRNHLKADMDLKPSDLNRKIDWTEDHFQQNIDNLKKIYFTFGKEIWNHLSNQDFEEMDVTDRWKLLTETIEELSAPKYYITKKNGKIKLTLFESGDMIKSFDDPVDAINDFFFLRTTSEALDKAKGTLMKKLSSVVEASQGYISKNKIKLDAINQNTQYKIWADILMANLYLVAKGTKKVTLPDFTGSEVTIKLKPDLNAQKNAEIFYRKAKNQEIQIKKLSESISQKKTEIEIAFEQLRKLEKIETLAEFKSQFKGRSEAMKKEEPFPFHQVEYQGYQIWIGKNATNNDLLTLKYTHKDDMWLHVKDVAGSHVVIKHKSGMAFPKEVIERAAELAAYNSKRKTEILTPVAYTLKKFVRKRKGAPPGSVMVDREDVLMVTPKL